MSQMSGPHMIHNYCKNSGSKNIGSGESKKLLYCPMCGCKARKMVLSEDGRYYGNCDCGIGDFVITIC